MQSVVCTYRSSLGLSDRDLQLQLMQGLLQRPSSSNMASNGMAAPRMGPMQGLLMEETPGASLNRGQLLQALFKLELELQTPKVSASHFSYCCESFCWVKGL